MKTGFLGAAALALVTFAARDAFCQGADPAAAQALYDRAVELMQAKNYAEACPKLEEVTRLVPDGFGAKLTLAECYEAEGKLASAWTQYSFVESVSARTNQPERQKLAGDKAAALKPRLAHLTITVADATKATPGLVVTKGGAAVGAAQFGEALPIDVGTHAIEATAPGKKKWTGEAKIEADGTSVTIEIPALEDAPAEQLPPGGGGGGAPAEKSSPPTWLFPAGLAVGGTGVATLIVGGVLGGLAMSKNSDAEAACPGGFCSQEGNDLRVSAGTFADAATGLFVAGGVLTAGGVLMVILSPTVQGTDEPEKDKAAIELHVAPNGLSLTGSF
ncbi:MAG TPA: hypothetical protein VL400_00310 [Polyangiaceae bacterium]|nr:hypothetical protein [Polyangiaceae bacterium]